MSPEHSFELSAFLRSLFLIISAGVYTAILGLPAFVSCLLDRSGHWPSIFQRIWVHWLLRTNGIRLRLRGIENLKQGQSYILVSNHASLLDIPGIISAFPFAVRFLAKKSLLRIPVFGWYLYLSGHILIERDSVKSALKGLKRASSALQQGISVIVFPEGTRSLDGEVKEFKGGAFLLAQNSKSPLVPIGISGSFEMLPRTGWCFRPGIMHIRIGEPISTRDLSPQESRNLMGTVRHTIIQSLKA